MLEITISGSEKMLLQESKLFDNNDVIDFSLLLTYDKIIGIEDKEYKKVSLAEFNPKREYNNLIEKISEYNEIRIWYSSKECEDLNMYYYLVTLLSSLNKTIYSCNVFDENKYCLGCYTSDEIDKLLINTKKLSKGEIDKITLTWKQLEQENADLRLIEGNKLVSHNFDFLDNLILEELKKYQEPVRYYSFVGELMSNRIYGLCSDLFFSARIDCLIEIGKIKIAEIKKEKNSIGELVNYKYIQIG